eukprot:5748272-Amphidinium_carterae.1
MFVLERFLAAQQQSDERRHQELKLSRPSRDERGHSGWIREELEGQTCSMVLNNKTGECGRSRSQTF